MKKSWLGWMALLLCVLCIACKPRHKPDRAMYYWRTTFNPTAAEDSFVLRHHINKLYVKYLDIGWSPEAGAVPLSITRFPDFNKVNEVYGAMCRSGHWVPVVYITNECFLNLPQDSLPVLVTRIITAIQAQIKSQSAQFALLKEIQIDCDWSKASHDRYFRFLTLLKQQLKPRNIALSITLRLHQYKYPVQTGVPPADRCMLMLYNMGKVEQLSQVNSIYSDSLTGLYLDKVKPYPLPLDAVVPLYSWLTVYRNHKLLTLNRRYSEAMLQDAAAFRKLSDWYMLRKDTVMQGTLYKTGDVFKIERIGARELQAAAKRIKQVSGGESGTIALYDLDESQLSLSTYETIEHLFAGF